MDRKEEASVENGAFSEETFSEGALSSFVVVDDEEPRVVLRSPADCSSIVPRPAHKKA